MSANKRYTDAKKRKAQILEAVNRCKEAAEEKKQAVRDRVAGDKPVVEDAED